MSMLHSLLCRLHLVQPHCEVVKASAEGPLFERARGAERPLPVGRRSAPVAAAQG